MSYNSGTIAQPRSAPAGEMAGSFHKPSSDTMEASFAKIHISSWADEVEEDMRSKIVELSRATLADLYAALNYKLDLLSKSQEFTVDTTMRCRFDRECPVPPFNPRNYVVKPSILRKQFYATVFEWLKVNYPSDFPSARKARFNYLIATCVEFQTTISFDAVMKSCARHKKWLDARAVYEQQGIAGLKQRVRDHDKRTDKHVNDEETTVIRDGRVVHENEVIEETLYDDPQYHEAMAELEQDAPKPRKSRGTRRNLRGDDYDRGEAQSTFTRWIPNIPEANETVADIHASVPNLVRAADNVSAASTAANDILTQIKEFLGHLPVIGAKVMADAGFAVDIATLVYDMFLAFSQENMSAIPTLTVRVLRLAGVGSIVYNQFYAWLLRRDSPTQGEQGDFDEGEPQSASDRGISEIMLGLIGALATNSVATDKQISRVNGLFLLYDRMVRVAPDAGNLLAKVCSMLPSCVKAWITYVHPDSWFLVETLPGGELQLLSDYFEYTVTIEGIRGLARSTAEQDKCLTFVKRFHQITIDLVNSKARLGSTAASFMMRLQVCVTKCFEVIDVTAHNGITRRVPFVVYLSGDPGVSKSSLAPKIIMDLTPEEFRDDNMIYVRNNACKHYDGYFNQYACYMDEYAVRDEVGDGESDPYLEMMQLVSSAPYPLPQASVEAKGKVMFTSRLMVISSNNAYPTPRGMNCAPLWRRRNLLFRVRVKEEYTLPDKCRLDGEKCMRLCGGDATKCVEFAVLKPTVKEDAEPITYYDYPTIQRLMIAECKRHNMTENSRIAMMAKYRSQPSLIDSLPITELPIPEELKTLYRDNAMRIEEFYQNLKEEEAMMAAKRAEWDRLRASSDAGEAQMFQEVVPRPYEQGEQWSEAREHFDQDSRDQEEHKLISAYHRHVQHAAQGGTFMTTKDIRNAPLPQVVDPSLEFDYEHVPGLTYMTESTTTFTRRPFMKTLREKCVAAYPNLSAACFGVGMAYRYICNRSFTEVLLKDFAINLIAGVSPMLATLLKVANMAYMFYQMVKTLFPKKEEVVHEAEGKTYDEKRKARKAKKVASKRAIQSQAQSLDKNADELAFAVARKSMVTVEYQTPGGNTCRTLGLGLDGTYLLMPKHALENETGYIRDGEQFDVIMVNGARNRIVFNEEQYASVEDGDVAMYDMKLQGIFFPKMTSLFITDEDLCHNSKFKGAIIVPSDPTNSLVGFKMRCGNVEQQTRAVKYKGGGQMDYCLADGWKYDIDTYRGDCGAPLIAMEPRMIRKFCGIHVTGVKDKNYGASECVTQELIESLKDAIVKTCGVPITGESQFDTGTVEYSAKVCFPVGNFCNQKVVQDIVRSSAKTRVLPSVLHGALRDPVTAPAVLTDKDPRITSDIAGVIPKGVEKYGEVTSTWNKKFLDEIRHDMLMQQMALSAQETRVLTDQEAVGGIRGVEYFDAINAHSSAGYPWKKMMPPGLKGKEFFLRRSEVDNRVEDVVDRRLIDAIAWREICAKHGHRVDSIWNPNPKDERRSLDKIGDANTRLFTIGPLDYTILGRKYFLAHNAFMYRNRLKFESAIGIDTWGPEWDVMTRLLTVHSNVFACDYHKWDGRYPTQIMEQQTILISDWYAWNEFPGVFTSSDFLPTYNRPWLNDESETMRRLKENGTVRFVLMHEDSFCQHQFSNIRYYTMVGNSSGLFSTVNVNTLGNSFFVKHAWMELTGTDLATMANNVVFFVYGDDFIASVSDEYRDLFNAVTFQKCMAEHGIKVTPASNKTADMVAYGPIEDFTFLKCGFRKERNMWRSLMSLDTINELVNWIRDAQDVKEACEDNCNDALRFMYHYGYGAFTDFRCKLLDACMQRQLKFSLHTYTYYDMLYKAMCDK